MSDRSKRGRFSVLDLGCGDGNLLFSLRSKGLLKNVDRAVGVDESDVRIKRLVSNVDGVVGLVSDACKVEGLQNAGFDLIICSQLIEHVPQDRALLAEIRRLLSKGGSLYISSVIKKPWSFWFYRRSGQFRLDPTHVREYPSSQAFLLLLRQEGFDPHVAIKTKIKYSLVDLLLRSLTKLRFCKPRYVQTIFLGKRFLTRLRNFLELAVFGYEQIEVLATFTDGIE